MIPPPRLIAWLAGRGRIEEAIRPASVLAPQDKNIHFREVEPKLCYWNDQLDETVLVQLTEESPELNAIEDVEAETLEEPLDNTQLAGRGNPYWGSAWLSGREDHSWQNKPVHTYGRSKNSKRQAGKTVKSGKHSAWLPGRMDLVVEETGGEENGRNGMDMDLNALLSANRGNALRFDGNKDGRFGDVSKLGIVKKNTELKPVPNPQHAWLDKKFFGGDIFDHIFSAWLAGRSIDDVVSSHNTWPVVRKSQGPADSAVTHISHE